MSERESIVQSYSEEMLDQEIELKKQINVEKIINTNILRFNAILCIVTMCLVMYFAIAQNYILNWRPGNVKYPNRVFNLGIKSFRVDNFASFYVCLNFSNNCKVNESELCRNIDLSIPIDLENECEELKAIYLIGIIVSIFQYYLNEVYNLFSLWYNY